MSAASILAVIAYGGGQISQLLDFGRERPGGPDRLVEIEECAHRLRLVRHKLKEVYDLAGFLVHVLVDGPNGFAELFLLDRQDRHGRPHSFSNSRSRRV